MKRSMLVLTAFFVLAAFAYAADPVKTVVKDVKQTAADTGKAGKELVKKSAETGKDVMEKGAQAGKKVAEKGEQVGKAVSEKGAQAASVAASATTGTAAVVEKDTKKAGRSFGQYMSDLGTKIKSFFKK
jgi:uncharacterized protein YoxC